MKNEFFESIMSGLKEAVDDAKSAEKTLKRTRRSYMIVPIKQFSAEEIRNIRIKNDMTQKLFASYLGVSAKTVESWEQGLSHPSGSSSRLLSMFEMNENLAKDFPFVSCM